jgi:hypothetical protein
MADPTHFTTEQTLPFTIVMKDFRGRAVAFDGNPVGEVSDPTVISVGDITKNDDGTYSGVLNSIVQSAPDTSARLTVTGDSDPGPDVKPVTAFLDVIVDADQRSSQRIVEITASAPVDKP